MESNQNEKQAIQKRRSIRFKNDAQELAYIEIPERNLMIAAVLIDESSRGAGLLIDSTYSVAKDVEVVVRVGKMDRRRTRVVWSKDLGLSGERIGIEYLD